MSGDDDVGAFFKIGAVFGNKLLILFGAFFGELRKPENIAHGLGEADQRLYEDLLFLRLRFRFAKDGVEVGQAGGPLPFGDIVGNGAGYAVCEDHKHSGEERDQ